MEAVNKSKEGINASDLKGHIHYYKDESFLQQNIHLSADTVKRLKGDFVELVLGSQTYYADFGIKKLMPRYDPNPWTVVPFDFNESALKADFPLYMDILNNLPLTDINKVHFQRLDRELIGIMRFDIPDLSKIDPIGFDSEFLKSDVPVRFKEVGYQVKMIHEIEVKRLTVSDKEYLRSLQTNRAEIKPKKNKGRKL